MKVSSIFVISASAVFAAIIAFCVISRLGLLPGKPKPKKENLDLSFDPSIRAAAGIAGPVQEGYCGNCS